MQKVLKLTVVLDTFSEASLQALVHGLQTRRDVLVSLLDRLFGPNQLLQSRQHPDKGVLFLT